ncbi:hypothetical protein H2202_000677 [Exophiala xenobiotica]|nr:hypothetical protein H2202_000677 [Exophiala xenobiotica]KAK5210048.1 hypothetical protein LTR41_004680 [Exophiala xenobiotica]KAK5225921.1 hypothetical protein LTR72_003824 [Exophiala xenobiotica]KAK5330052.1 hypothetical protein LTR93_001641 [Exophiala xenobiotica]KAK5558738.1 hypothetical protein LTR46_002927 [Exophiala xenobiotica]
MDMATTSPSEKLKPRVKCDAAQTGLPCTRCRVDGIQDCAFISSRRGTYDRWRSLKSESRTPRALSTSESRFESASPEGDNLGDSAARQAANSGPPAAARSNALAVGFENFLRQGDSDVEGLVGKYGLVLLGDSSPLTFALKELQPDKRDSRNSGSSEAINSNRAISSGRSGHPSHLSAADLTYLQAKGALTAPTNECLTALIQAFMDKFYPLCSIVDRSEFMRQHQSRRLPWILLQAACLIGATYCDADVLKKAGFKSRQAARRFFYDKAKVLYDVGYETNSVVLLQAIVMLTFWGPDMKGYWNPCSWIGVAVTIAESLGIHRSAGYSTLHKDKGLLRRLWWTIAVRDAYCGTLLGRPFRVNMSHSDAPMLTNDDFGQDDNTPSGSGDPSQLYMQYQIHFAKLSLILRRIVNTRFNIGLDSTTPETLRDLLVQWRGDVPPSINWPAYGVSPSIFAECLKILYHHQLILIYLPRGDSPNLSAAGLADTEAPTSEIAESAAQTIASTSLSLMTRSMVHSLPQEVFPAFFVAGIVFFRLIRRSQPLIAQLGQAALDNCQIILHEVRDCWEPAFWGMRIFEFLLAGLNNNASSDAATAEGQDIITSLGKGAELGTEQLIENSASTHDSFALHNTFEMGPAIHNLRKAAQQDTALTTQLFDRFLDPANYLIMPTSLGDQETFDFEMAEW